MASWRDKDLGNSSNLLNLWNYQRPRFQTNTSLKKCMYFHKIRHISPLKISQNENDSLLSWTDFFWWFHKSRHQQKIWKFPFDFPFSLTNIVKYQMFYARGMSNNSKPRLWNTTFLLPPSAIRQTFTSTWKQNNKKLSRKSISMKN